MGKSRTTICGHIFPFVFASFRDLNFFAKILAMYCPTQKVK